jgi:hypothetical protein
VVGCRIFHVNELKVVSVVSMEVKGPVFQCDITQRGYVVGSTFTKNAIYQKRLKTPSSMAVFRSPQNQQFLYWQQKSLIALGALSEVIVCSMRPIQELIRIKRPALCKPNAVPYLSFGVGLTPSKQDQTVIILAIAWDNLIQLIFFDNQEKLIKLDGVYL